MTSSRLLKLALCACGLLGAAWGAAQHAKSIPANYPDWPQWARTPQHRGSTPAVGQNPTTQLAELTYDPFVAQEQAESNGELLAHYQVPLVNGNNVFLEVKTGQYISCNPPGSGMPYPCGPQAWDSEIWTEQAFAWENGALLRQWSFQSDWKPEPSGPHMSTYGLGLQGWEPVFHAALWKAYVFVPGFSGSVYKINASDGTLVTQYTPFGTTSANTFVSGPLTIDLQGNIYYNVVVMDGKYPWKKDVKGAWLVKITAAGVSQTVSYATLVPGAPKQCGHVPCGSQRPGINVAPAVSPDGQTIYTVSRAHFVYNRTYIVAVNSDLTPKWQTALRDLAGSLDSGFVLDEASSTPVVVPDGGVLFGVVGLNYSRGYLNKFNSAGQYLTSYNFGWDSTPAIYVHDGTYSVIIKDNHYGTGGPYYITQLNNNLIPEWQFEDPNNDEWCVNAPAVDVNGTVYANSEDGNVYVINQGGSLKGNLFLQSAIGAAYTPIALGLDGKIYTENDGDMFVVGN
jgi:hypothetical protein